MKGDFSRFTFDPKKHYSAVRMQQGRVQLDADWNEQLDISQYRLAVQMSDFIGYSGVPAGVDGGDPTDFTITPNGDNFQIGAGRIYVAGELYENGAPVDFTAQPDYPGATLPSDDGTYVAYLDVWPRHMTPLEDPDIGEVALGGVDTATRVKNVWQVKLVAENSGNDDYNDPNWKPTGVEPISTGQMTARVEAGAALENQLYRIEIHQSGSPDSATFKWSRDNGSVAAQVVSIGDKTITVSSAGRDPEMGFAVGQWIELRSETQTLTGAAGTLYQLINVQGNALTVTVPSASLPLPTDVTDQTWIVRRWDSQEGNSERGDLPLSDEWTLLENDIQVQFDLSADKIYKTGDYWLIPARYLTGEIEWPTDSNNTPLPQPPQGIQHHYVPLATLTLAGTTWSLENDLRTIFSPLIGGFVSKEGDSSMSGPLTIQYTLQVDGNVGIGTTPVDESQLKVLGTTQLQGGVAIGTDFAVPTDGLIVQGNVGIGTETPTATLDVQGDVSANKYVVQGGFNDGPPNGIWMSNPHDPAWGIYRSEAGQNRSLAGGNAVAGAGAEGYALRLRTSEDDNSGLIVENNNEELNLSVKGSDGMTYIRGNVGIGTETPKSKLSVSGGVGIGSNYAGNNTAPTDGLIVQGNVGIGTQTPTVALEVAGAASLNNALSVSGTTTLNDALTVADGKNTTLGGSLTVSGTTALNDALSVAGAATLNDALTVADGKNTTLGGSLTVSGTTTLNDALSVAGAATLNDALSVGGSLTVSGTTTLNDTLTVANGKNTTLTGSLTVQSDVSANKYVVESSQGIWLSSASDSTWGIYRAKSGAGNSLAGAGKSAVAGAGFSDYALRLRTFNSSNQGLIIENSAEQLNLSVRGSDGLTYIRGNVGIGTKTPTAALEVNGTVKADTLQVDNITTPGDTLGVTGDTILSGTLTATGETDLQGNLVLGQNQHGRRFILHPRANSGQTGDFLQITCDNSAGNWDWSKGITFVRSNGHVGIGTQTPTAALEVNGTVKATAFEGDGSVPQGVIVMWSGSSTPAGWALCDGSNQTPDLRNRFIVGAGGEYDIGDTGGAKQVTLTIDQMPSHNHDNDTYQYLLKVDGYNTDKKSDDDDKKQQPNLSEKGAIQPQGGGQAHENRPPYYALAFIMKL